VISRSVARQQVKGPNYHAKLHFTFLSQFFYTIDSEPPTLI